GLDLSVGTVGDVEDLVRVLHAEGREVHEEVVQVGHREADLGDLGVGLQGRLAHVEQRLLQGQGVEVGEGLQQHPADVVVDDVEVDVGRRVAPPGGDGRRQDPVGGLLQGG